jgi:hypothetical protein
MNVANSSTATLARRADQRGTKPISQRPYRHAAISQVVATNSGCRVLQVATQCLQRFGSAG